VSVRFAKINRPQLAQAYPRQRLFSLLDSAATRPLTWISANAGAGKTALVASYLQARQLPDLWYRLDSRDMDAATFFYFLREAARQAGLPEADALPLLTSEYAGAEVVFAHNFFAQLFVDAPRSYALVFDNYQDLPEASPLHTILSEALEEIPEGVRVFILSRTASPAALARLRANQGMTVIDAPALRLDREETAGLLASQPQAQLDDDVIDTIYRETDGWAAGVILLLEHVNHYGVQGWGGGRQSREAMFHYFAAELFENASEDMRSFLGWTAIVPQFDIHMARSLTGMDNVDSLVRELLQKNYFIYEQDTRNLTYQYHPLFREFLREAIKLDENPQHYHEVLCKAARVLRDLKQAEDAADLYIEARDWQSAADIVMSEAQNLYRQGRVRQIEQWIVSMPEQVRLSFPWLDYWFGICRIGFDLYVAREAFERAYEGFQASDEVVGRCLAAAWVVETYIYEWGDFKPLDRWIDELDSLHGAHADLLPPLAGAHVTVALFTAHMYRRPDHPQLPALSMQVYGIIERLPDDLLRLTAGTHLLLYYAWWQGDIARGGALVKLLRPLAQSKRVSPLLQITWLAIEANYSWMAAENSHCIETAEQALQIASQTGIHVWNFMLLAAAGWGSLTSDKLEQARGYLDRMAATVQPGRLLDLCHFRYQLFVEAMHRNDVEAMFEYGSASLQLSRDAGVPWAEGIMLTAYARAQAARGEFELADQLLSQADQLAYRLGSDTIAHSELLARVELGLPRDNELATLQRLMSVSRRRGLANFSWWRGAAMAKIFAQALMQNIETDFVREAIKRRGVIPEPSVLDVEAVWPWPVRIYTLGRFAVIGHDKPEPSSGKAQKKPLELVKAIIAFGSHDVNEVQLMEVLWPDSDGDMAKQSLKSTVHRLRKLLGTDVLQWSEGRLGLDARYCWVDVWVLERLVNSLLQAPPTKPAQLERALQQIDKLYTGRFLQGEEEAYMLGLRERLRSKLLRLLNQMAERFMRQGAYEQALITNQKGLEIEPLDEPFYQGIMQCQQAQGRIAEALSTYEHYRHIAENTLGIAPAPEMAALAATLREHNQ
jgi:LuxR family maltose regulon positive regulatory protein